MSIAILLAIAAAIGWSPALTRGSQAGPSFVLGEAPAAVYDGELGSGAVVQAAFVGVDTSSRSAVASYFNSEYVSGPALGPTGSVAGCSPDSTSDAFKQAVLKRINFYRGMAGVPAAPTISATNSAKDQQAALMFVANGALSHNPPSSWTCWTAEGAEAAGKSNIAIGVFGWNAIDMYMRDNGSNNAAVGHRRWVLYPQTQTFGTGDVNGVGGNAMYQGRGNALWVQDANMWAARPAT